MAQSSPEPQPPVEFLQASAFCEPLGGTGQEGASVIDAGTIGDNRRRIRLSMGQRTTGGYTVALASSQPTQVTDGIARIEVEWTAPGPDAMVTQVITRPCLDIAVPAAYSGVEFVDLDGQVRGAASW